MLYLSSEGGKNMKVKFFDRNMSYQFTIEKWLEEMTNKIRVISSAMSEREVMIIYQDVISGEMQ